jgi:hypothetical protein
MKGNGSAVHLSDEQFADLLAGAAPSPAVEQHLALCDLCRAEVDAVSASFESFRGLATTWTQTTAPARIPVPSAWSLRRGQLPSLGSGLTAMATAGLLAFGLGFTPAAFHTAPAAHAPAAAPSNADLAADNRLMQSIDQELGYRSQSGTASVNAHPGAHLPQQRTAETVAN